MADENELSDLARRAAAGADMMRDIAQAEQLSKQQATADLASIKTRLDKLERAVAEIQVLLKVADVKPPLIKR